MSGDEIKNISRWMDGQTIFITGSSGFVGKVLVYKLLKSCTSLKAIYLLLRAKRGKTSTERLEELFSSSVYSICYPVGSGSVNSIYTYKT